MIFPYEQSTIFTEDGRVLMAGVFPIAVTIKLKVKVVSAFV